MTNVKEFIQTWGTIGLVVVALTGYGMNLIKLGLMLGSYADTGDVMVRGFGVLFMPLGVIIGFF